MCVVSAMAQTPIQWTLHMAEAAVRSAFNSNFTNLNNNKLNKVNPIATGLVKISNGSSVTDTLTKLAEMRIYVNTHGGSGGGTTNMTQVSGAIHDTLTALKSAAVDISTLSLNANSIRALGSAPSTGNIYINTSDGKLYYKIGSTWTPSGTSAPGGGSSSTLLTGLLGGYKFDETLGNAVDVLGVNTGTANAITYNASGKIGRCFLFNGTSSYVSLGNVYKPTASITIDAWIQSSSTTDQSIIDCHSYNADWTGYQLQLYADGTIGFLLGSNTTTMLDVSGNPIFPVLINNGAMHHVKATWDGTTPCTLR